MILEAELDRVDATTAIFRLTYDLGHASTRSRIKGHRRRRQRRPQTHPRTLRR